MALLKSRAKTCSELLRDYEAKEGTALNPYKLRFEGVGGLDVYNIAAPFEDDGERVIAGRVEARDSEQSQIVFFVERGGVWTPREGAPRLELQDPFHARIGGELVLGGVEIYPHPAKAGELGWRTVIFRGTRIADLQPFFAGPDGMKDLRLVELEDGSVGVFTRPRGEKGGLGKIGFARIPSLECLTVEAVQEAPLFEDQFADEEWGGANELHLLADGRVGVLGHIACFDAAGDRHYYPMVFLFDPDTGEYTDIELIAARSRFLPGEAKRSDLADVVFSGGLIRRGDGLADLYAGVGDAEAQRITIEDPFVR